MSGVHGRQPASHEVSLLRKAAGWGSHADKHAARPMAEGRVLLRSPPRQVVETSEAQCPVQFAGRPAAPVELLQVMLLCSNLHKIWGALRSGRHVRTIRVQTSWGTARAGNLTYWAILLYSCLQQLECLRCIDVGIVKPVWGPLCSGTTHRRQYHVSTMLLQRPFQGQHDLAIP